MSEREKPRAILISRNFPPLIGGMERLNFHIYQELREAFDLTVIGPSGADKFCDQADHVRTSPCRPIWRFLTQSCIQCIIVCLRIKPKLIFSGSGVTALPAVISGLVLRTPVITYLHGLDIVSRHPIYRRIFLPAIRKSTAWIVNSHNTGRLAVEAGIPRDRISVIFPGVTLPDVTPAQRAAEFRQKIGAGKRPIILSVGRTTKRKGLVEFLRECMPAICKALPDTLLLIIGNDPENAIGNANIRESSRIKKVAIDLGLQNNICLYGRVDDESLSIALASSQVHVFPVRELSGDVEGFGMVAIEAAAHGLPTIAFNAGGVADAVSENVSGRLIPPGDYMRFTENVIEVLKKDTDFPGCKAFAKSRDWIVFGQKLRAVVNNILQKPPLSHRT